MQQHNLSISGGSESTTYYLGLGYLKQYGFIDFTKDTYTRYNVNLSLNTTVTNWLDVQGRFMVAREDRVTPYVPYSSSYPMWYYVYRWPRTYPRGLYKGKPFRSAVVATKQADLKDNEQIFTRLSLGTSMDLTENLTLKADFTYNSRNLHIYRPGGKIKAYNFWYGNLAYGTYTGPSFNSVSYTSDWDKRINLRTMANYRKDWGNHSIEILAGVESEVHKFWGQYSKKEGLIDPTMEQIDLALGDQFVNGYAGDEANMGVFGRINYSYKNKYLLQINGRFDASSSFPASSRWGFFPSFSAAYVISEEPFMDAAEPIISFLKIRGSYGSVGNADVGYYPFLSLMPSYHSGWFTGGTETKLTFSTPEPVPASLTWETVTTLNIGLNAKLFSNSLTLTFNWYQRVTSDMISSGITLPSTYGTVPPQRNYGELTTTGWGIKAEWTHNFGEAAHISVMANLSNYKGVITKYANPVKTIPYSISTYNSSYYEGMVLGEIWGYVTDRLFQRSDFKQDANGNLITNEEGEYVPKDGIPTQDIFEGGWFSYGPGDVKYKDLNGDGVINYGKNTVKHPGDQKVIGNYMPKYQYGIRISGGWKGFDVSMFFRASVAESCGQLVLYLCPDGDLLKRGMPTS